MANERRLRANGVAGALTAGLNNTTDTTMSSGGLADLPAIDTTDHAAITLFKTDGDGRVTQQEVVYVTAHTASATSATIVRAQEGTTEQTWATGDKWVHGATVRDFVGGRLGRASRTAGNVSATGSSSYQTLDSALDLTIAAQAGDVLEVALEAIVSARASGANVDNINWTAYTRVSGADVNNIAGTGTASVTAWFTPDVLWTVGGTTSYVVQSGDVSGGKVTLRLRYRVDDIGETRTIFANATNPLNWRVKNLGPQEA